ncbi:hypothetical protein AMTR_s00007p00260180 [Amborella trichopoda]|uniref:Uncharacterized protein n=1 Tax=Amborella trichopoda TaxID=13333 RepID=W1P6K2_AMBTC|nr:hypothetical protein AMTR_s00007p00260180 [Amborella trichopoda]
MEGTSQRDNHIPVLQSKKLWALEPQQRKRQAGSHLEYKGGCQWPPRQLRGQRLMVPVATTAAAWSKANGEATTTRRRCR